MWGLLHGKKRLLDFARQCRAHHPGWALFLFLLQSGGNRW
nr:MAG TPA: Protein of unknown function (DUF2811) [Caudoviricetes sp.]